MLLLGLDPFGAAYRTAEDVIRVVACAGIRLCVFPSLLHAVVVHVGAAGGLAKCQLLCAGPEVVVAYEAIALDIFALLLETFIEVGGAGTE